MGPPADSSATRSPASCRLWSCTVARSPRTCGEDGNKTIIRLFYFQVGDWLVRVCVIQDELLGSCTGAVLSCAAEASLGQLPARADTTWHFMGMLQAAAVSSPHLLDIGSHEVLLEPCC